MIKFIRKYLDRNKKAANTQVQRLLPHEIYPELLDWEKDDKLEATTLLENFTQTCYFISLDEKFIYLSDLYRKERAVFSGNFVMKNFINVSLRTRKADEYFKNTSEYQNILNDFKNSVNELKEKYNGQA